MLTLYFKVILYAIMHVWRRMQCNAINNGRQENSLIHVNFFMSIQEKAEKTFVAF